MHYYKWPYDSYLMIKIRKALLNDIESIAKIGVKLIEHGDGIIKDSYPQNLKDYLFNKSKYEFSKTFIKNSIHSKNGLVIISEIDNIIVGFLQVSICKNFPFFKLKKYGKIQAIYVKEKYRKKGVSTMLLDEAMKWCKKKGLTRISLDVLPNNFHAIKVYEKWGFIPFLLEMRKDA